MLRYPRLVLFSLLYSCLHHYGCHSYQTMMIGDSILASNTPVQDMLQTFSETVFFNTATIGSSIQDGWKISIPSQYMQYRTDDVTTIIMDGGGNDVNSQRSECERFSSGCIEMIDRIVVILQNLFDTMRRDGVHSILYCGFYYIPGLERAVDYGTEEIKKVCIAEEGCYFTDLRNLTVSLGWDGMHPVENSFRDIAIELWKTKVAYNITM